MTRIFHITQSHEGGGGIYATRLDSALRDAGLPSTLLGADDSGLSPRSGFIGRLGSLSDRILASIYHRGSKTPFHSFLRIREWSASSEISSKDIVHLHSITGFIGVHGLTTLLESRPKVFWTAHNPWMFTGGCVSYAGCEGFTKGCPACPILKGPLTRFPRFELIAKQRWLERFEIRPIANSYWMAAMMSRSPIFSHVGEIPVVPPIVDIAFLSFINRVATREALGFLEDRFVVGLSASSLTDPGKGIVEFFATLPGDAEWLEKVTFILIGDGIVRVPSGVSTCFTGRISEPKILADLYASCDCFVSPSFMETFGMAILEAQACGTPVVAFSTGGTPEAVYPGSHCRLVANRDFVLLHGAIEDAVSKGPVKPSCRKSLSDWVRSRHCAESIGAQQIESYQGTETSHV